jgi:hypothetical protein
MFQVVVDPKCHCTTDGLSGGATKDAVGCDYHYDTDDARWCYVVGGVACISAHPSTDDDGSAWIECDQCDRANANRIIDEHVRNASFRNIPWLVATIQALTGACSVAAVATIASVCGEGCVNERLHLQVNRAAWCKVVATCVCTPKSYHPDAATHDCAHARKPACPYTHTATHAPTYACKSNAHAPTMRTWRLVYASCRACHCRSRTASSPV